MYALVDTYIQRGAMLSNMVPYGAIWDHMGNAGPCGATWGHMVLHGAKLCNRDHVEPRGDTRGHMGPYGAIWAIGVMSCHMGPCGAI